MRRVAYSLILAILISLMIALAKIPYTILDYSTLFAQVNTFIKQKVPILLPSLSTYRVSIGIEGVTLSSTSGISCGVPCSFIRLNSEVVSVIDNARIYDFHLPKVLTLDQGLHIMTIERIDIHNVSGKALACLCISIFPHPRVVELAILLILVILGLVFVGITLQRAGGVTIADLYGFPIAVVVVAFMTSVLAPVPMVIVGYSVNKLLMVLSLYRFEPPELLAIAIVSTVIPIAMRYLDKSIKLDELLILHARLTRLHRLARYIGYPVLASLIGVAICSACRIIVFYPFLPIQTAIEIVALNIALATLIASFSSSVATLASLYLGLGPSLAIAIPIATLFTLRVTYWREILVSNVASAFFHPISIVNWSSMTPPLIATALITSLSLVTLYLRES